MNELIVSRRAGPPLKRLRFLFYIVGQNSVSIPRQQIRSCWESRMSGLRKKLLIRAPIHSMCHPTGGALQSSAIPARPTAAKGTVHMTFLLNFFDQLQHQAPEAKH